MKKIVVIMICTGMSLGLLIGGARLTNSNNAAKVLAVQIPGEEALTCAAPVSLDELLIENLFSCSRIGLCENEEVAKIKTDIEQLKTELVKLEKDSDEYNTKLGEIHKLWGRLSVVLGELNSRIDIDTEIGLKISQEAESFDFPSSSICGKIRYATEDLF